MCLVPDFEPQDLKHYFCKKLLLVSSLSIFLSFVSCGIYLYYLPDLQYLEVWDASFAQNWDKSSLILIFLVLRHLQVAGCSFSVMLILAFFLHLIFRLSLSSDLEGDQHCRT